MSGLGPQGRAIFEAAKRDSMMALAVSNPYAHYKITAEAILDSWCAAEPTADPAIPTCPLRGDVSENWTEPGYWLDPTWRQHYVVIFCPQSNKEPYIPGWGMRGQQYPDHEWCPLRGPLKKVTR